MVQPRGSGLIHGLFAVDILLEMDIRRLKDGYDVMDKLYNANTWFKHESSQRMLRTLDGSARAYLSNRYRYIDNIDIAGVTLPILGGLPDIRFESCQITESRMYIKAVNPRLQAEVSPGDIVQAGIIISNSEGLWCGYQEKSPS